MFQKHQQTPKRAGLILYPLYCKNKSRHLGAQDYVLGRGRSVPLETVIFPLPVELLGVRDAEAKRVLFVDGDDVGQGPRGARRSVDLVASRPPIRGERVQCDSKKGGRGA